MRFKTLVVGFVLGCGILTGAPASGEENAAGGSEQAVKQMVAAYADAFNRQQLDVVMGFWTEQGVHSDQDTGERTVGRDAIAKDIAEVFAREEAVRISGEIERVRMITENVASVEGQVSVVEGGEAPVATQFSAILVHQNGAWKINEIKEAAVPAPATSYDALQQLEWLVGTWVDEADEARSQSVFRWSDNQAFLIRSFSVETDEGVEQQGTQVIGWDPRGQQIRSWSFHSDGSFGDGFWVHNGNDWVIRSSQTSGDGEASAGTFVLSRVGDDELTFQLVGLEVEGEPQPATDPVRARRVDEAVTEVENATAANQ